MNKNFLKITCIAAVVTFAVINIASAATEQVMLGGDKDAHGCIGSAGYSFDAGLGKCTRPWEEKSSLLIVAPKKVSCMGVGPMECLQVKTEDGKWGLMYAPINGFTYESGYTYKIRVIEKHIENPPSDASSIEYTLKDVLVKTPLRNTVWDIVSLNGKKINSFGRIAFVKDTILGKFCNRMSGSYSIDSNTLSTKGLMSTMMFCSDDSMDVETAFDISGAKWKINGNELTITTAKKDVLVWKQR